MDLLDFIVHFIGNALMTTFSIFCWIKFSNVNKSNSSKLIVILLTALSVTLISQFFPNPIKLIMTLLLLIVMNYFYINEQLKLSIVSVTISQLILVISEFSFAIIASLFYKDDIQVLTQQPLIFLSLNCYITILSFIIYKIGIVKWLYNLSNLHLLL